MELYRLPVYDDIAFSWDLESEVDFLGRVFERYVPFPVRRILEPACGTGRFLEALPGHGFRVTGYDSSEEMLTFAQERIAELGLEASAEAVPGDMRNAVFDPPFDAALNSINSFCYLLDDADVLLHLRGTAASLRPGGVYIVHLSTAYEGDLDAEGSTWEMERDGVKVVTNWKVESEDIEAKRAVHICSMKIDDRGEKRSLVDRHVLRLWTIGDLADVIRRSGAFRLIAIYGDGSTFREVPLGTHITGEMYNHYYVLESISAA